MYKFSSLILILILALAGCNKEAKTVEYTISDIAVELEGPVYEGSNEAEVKVNFNPEEVLKAEGFERKNIQDVRVKNIELQLEDSLHLNLFQTVLMQIVGGKAPLTPVALVSSISGNTDLEPTIAEKNSIEGIKDSEFFFYVIDANMKGHFNDNIKFKSTITFEIDVK